MGEQEARARGVWWACIMGKPISLVFEAAISLGKPCKQSAVLKTLFSGILVRKVAWKSRYFSKMLEKCYIVYWMPECIKRGNFSTWRSDKLPYSVCLVYHFLLYFFSLFPIDVNMRVSFEFWLFFLFFFLVFSTVIFLGHMWRSNQFSQSIYFTNKGRAGA